MEGFLFASLRRMTHDEISFHFLKAFIAQLILPYLFLKLFFAYSLQNFWEVKVSLKTKARTKANTTVFFYFHLFMLSWY